ncbi:MAG: class I SAM-dependent methyltransferase [Pseudomonadota bacterium]
MKPHSTEKSWQPDEIDYAGQEHLDEAYVSGYDQKAQVDPGEDIEALIKQGLSKHSSVIDLGAGTGTFAKATALLCHRVIAIDPSPAMYAYLQASIAAMSIDNLSAANAGFLTYEHTTEPVDFIYTRNALHQLPDFWKVQALANMHKLLRPGGIIRIKDLIYDFSPAETKEKISAWLAGAVDDSRYGWTAEELAEHVRREYSTFSWLFEQMLAQTGFEIIERDYRKSIYGTYTCRALVIT